MEAVGGLVGLATGLLGLVIVLILLIYPYVALGRIWLYSKQQVELLREVRAALRQDSK